MEPRSGEGQCAEWNQEQTLIDITTILIHS